MLKGERQDCNQTFHIERDGGKTSLKLFIIICGNPSKGERFTPLEFLIFHNLILQNKLEYGKGGGGGLHLRMEKKI